MIFLIATGKIDRNTLQLNGDHAVFILQAGPDRYRVKTVGLEQYQLMDTV